MDLQNIYPLTPAERAYYEAAGKALKLFRATYPKLKVGEGLCGHADGTCSIPVTVKSIEETSSIPEKFEGFAIMCCDKKGQILRE